MVVKLKGLGFSVEKYSAIADRKAVVTDAMIGSICSIGKKVPHTDNPPKNKSGTIVFVIVYELGLLIKISIIDFNDLLF